MLEPIEQPPVTYTYYGGVVDISTRKKNPVYDGDTLTILTDRGEDIFKKTRFRLIGIDTPEKTGDEKPWGLISREHLLGLLKQTSVWWKFTDPWGNTFEVPGITVRSTKYDKYGGRCLGEIWLPGGPRQLNLQMIDDGFARHYDGSAKTAYPLSEMPVQPEEES